MHHTPTQAPHLLAVPTGPCGLVLAFLPQTARHALRSTCSAMYALPATTTGLRLPVPFPGRCVGMCKARVDPDAGAVESRPVLGRLPFWGHRANRLILDVRHHTEDLLAAVSSVCSELGAKFCPPLVELRVTDCLCSAKKVILHALELLVRLWPDCLVELRGGVTSVALSVADFSPALAGRLAWCDAEIIGPPDRASQIQVRFPKLCNAFVRSHSALACSCPSLFPELRHMHVSGHSDLLAAPFAGRLLSLQWNTATVDFTADPRRGRVTRAFISSVEGLVPANLQATEELSFCLNADVSAAVMALDLPRQHLPCKHLKLAFFDKRAAVLDARQAATRLVAGLGPTTRSVTIVHVLVSQALAEALPAGVEHVTISAGLRSLMEAFLCLLRHAVHLKRLTVPCCFDEGFRTLRDRIRHLQQEPAAPVSFPIVELTRPWPWRLETWSEVPPGVVPRRVQPTTNSLSGPVPLPGQFHWCPEVYELELHLPLGPKWNDDQARRLRALLCGVQHVFVRALEERADAVSALEDEIRTACVFCCCLGRKLQSISCSEFLAPIFRQDAGLSEACPWVRILVAC